MESSWFLNIFIQYTHNLEVQFNIAPHGINRTAPHGINRTGCVYYNNIRLLFYIQPSLSELSAYAKQVTYKQGQFIEVLRSI